MPRNINWRIEVLFPIQDKRLIRYLRDDVLETYLHANRKVRCMHPDGTYTILRPGDGDVPLNPQEWLIKYHQQYKGAL
jgi:polyphosphate kinase